MNWIHRPHALVIVMLSLMGSASERSMWASDPEAEPSATAAAEGDPIVSIGKKMSTLASRLSESSANADPQREQLQQQIVNQLDALLKELENESQGKPSSGNSSGGGSSQQDTRTRIGEGTPQRNNPKNRGQGEPKEGESRQSSQRLGKSAPKVNLAELLQVVKQVWGHLPEKERERLRQLSGDQVLPGHDLAIERYFRSLADEPQREDLKP